MSELHHVKNLSGHSCTQDTHSMPSRIPLRTGGVTVRPLAQARICSATEQSKRAVAPQGATEQSLRAVVPQGATEQSLRAVVPQGATEQSLRAVVPQGATEQSKRVVVPQESHSVPSIYKQQLQVCAIICLCLAKY